MKKKRPIFILNLEYIYANVNKENGIYMPFSISLSFIPFSMYVSWFNILSSFKSVEMQNKTEKKDNCVCKELSGFN